MPDSNHIFDYYANCAENDKDTAGCSEQKSAWEGCTYASLIKDNNNNDINTFKFVDCCILRKHSPHKDAKRDQAPRKCYMHRMKERMAQKPLTNKFKDISFEPDFISNLDDKKTKIPLPSPSWIGLDVSFTLLTPWYSKDDRAFHVLDNPVRKDKVFGVPYMPASSWKGMLRWACRMHPKGSAGGSLFDHLEKTDNKMEGWQDNKWITHLFGNEKGETENFNQGALVFYPTWFDKIGFEVINPHSRATRAGTQPIYYEVVPTGTEGVLRLLYAPVPGSDMLHKEWLCNLIDAIECLLTTYGISAKRTAGWGTAEIIGNGWNAVHDQNKIAFGKTKEELLNVLCSTKPSTGGGL